MKNKIYYLGLIGCFLPITGGLFKIMHWPFAGPMLTLGMSLLALVFFPIALIDNYKGLGSKKPLLYWALILTIILNITGGLFKIQHWPGASYMMILGILSPLILFLPVYLYFYFKSKEQSLNNLFSILFLLVFFSLMDVLLTLRISKEAIEAPLIAMENGKMDDYFKIKKETCYKLLLNDSINPNKQQALDIKGNSENINSLINEIKNKIVIMAYDKEKADLMNYWGIKLKDNSNIPTFVLFYEKENKGSNLSKNLEKFKKSLFQSIKNNAETREYISDLLNINLSTKGKDWEINEFKNSPVVFALYQLNILKDNIAFAEIETLNLLCQGLKK